MLLSTLVAGSAAAASLAAAAPSYDTHHHHQLTFTDTFDAIDASAAEWLRSSKGAIDAILNKGASAGNNVVEKGTEWVQRHVNDEERFNVVSHPAFPEYKLRVNTKKPSLCDPDVKQISGYLDVAQDKHLFFWFFESRRNPKKDPLTMWLNGGPGCSSSTGLLFELGPCSIAANGTSTVFNPYSWTSVSNMIFLDQPVAVGYSYTEGQKVVTTQDAAKDVYAFLQLFMKAFNEYSGLEFSIAGESYGGTYIPQFAGYINDEQKKQHLLSSTPSAIQKDTTQHARINLKSVLIGNGLTDPYVQFASVPEYACAPSEHAFLDESSCTTLRNKVSTCQRLESYCYNNPTRFTCVPAALYCWGMYSPLQASGRNLYDIRKPCDRSEDADGPLCYREMSWIEKYLNKPEVKEELGVAKELDFTSCNMDVNRAFLMTGDSQHNSAAFLPPLLEDGIRVLIYAGNADAMCNYLGNKEWFTSLPTIFSSEIAKQVKTHPFNLKHPKSGKSSGNYYKAGPGAGNYSFIEIYEAGHMVPTDQPEVALDMFSKWIDNKEF